MNEGKSMKKPSAKGAWNITIAAALNAGAFVLLASINIRPVLLLTFALLEIAMIACAVGAWRQYAKQAEEYRRDQQGE